MIDEKGQMAHSEAAQLLKDHPRCLGMQDNALYPALVTFRPLPDHLGRRGQQVPPGWSPPEGSPLERPSEKRPVPTLLGHPLDSPDFALRWPKELFRQEAEALRWRDDGTQELLFEEAFVSSLAAEAVRRRAGLSAWTTRLDDPPQDNDAYTFVLDHVEELQLERSRPPTWRRRRRPNPSGPVAMNLVVSRFIDIVNDFDARGYFSREFVKNCSEDPDAGPRDTPGQVMARDLGWEPQWPLDFDELFTDLDNLFDVIEALHDRIARPRRLTTHELPGGDECTHYEDHSVLTGRALYRWRANRLLDEGALGLRLADDGEDVGRLVSTTDEARTELLQTMASRSDRSTGDRVRHAISMFRSRGATEDEKRSACTALALVLEERRPLLKETLLRKDEGALFQIANEFAIRHEDGKQQRDYRPGFRDWIFWWYLATIELTDRLLSDQPGTTMP